jgi:hypothetical protein
MARRTNGEDTAGVDADGRAARPSLKWQDIRGDTRRRADELLCTDAEAAALEALRVATGETDGGMERHTVRQYLIAERLADTRGLEFDRELLLCASFLHDAGLYPAASTGDVYIKDSVRYARRTLEPLGWPEDRLRLCLDTCEQHHAFTPSGRWATRWSSSAGLTSSRCCPSSRGSASLAPGSSASCGRQCRAPSSGPKRCRSLVTLAANAAGHVPSTATAAISDLTSASPQPERDTGFGCALTTRCRMQPVCWLRPEPSTAA